MKNVRGVNQNKIQLCCQSKYEVFHRFWARCGKNKIFWNCVVHKISQMLINRQKKLDSEFNFFTAHCLKETGKFSF